MHSRTSRSGFRDRVTAVFAATGVATLLAGFIVMGTATTAQAVDYNQGKDVPVCHATGNPDQPYERGGGDVPKAQIANPNGHGGPDVERHGQDIIPAFAAGSHGGQSWAAYAGRNTHLLYILENDCKEPTSVAPVPYDETEPTCDIAGVLVRMSQPTGIVASQSPAGTGPGSYTITFTPGAGYVLSAVAGVTINNSGVGTQMLTVAPRLTADDPACDGSDVIDIPAEPEPTDPCGPNNAYWVLPSGPDGVTWSIVGGDLIASTVQGVEFEDGTTTHNYGKASDSGVHCDDRRLPVPAAPLPNDPCGVGNATWVLPSGPDGVTWSIVGGDLIASTVQGVKFDDNTKSHSYGPAVDSGVLCSEPGTPTTPTKPAKPDVIVVSDAEVDTDCDLDEVVTTTTTTTTDWVFNESANTWVKDTPKVATAVTSRPATETECPTEVGGVETEAPTPGEQPQPNQPVVKPTKPTVKPVVGPDEVLGTEQPAAVPTAVDAGLGGPIAGTTSGSLLGQGLVGGGLLMLLLAGSMTMGRRERGAHQL